jgi:hypothetical protein
LGRVALWTDYSFERAIERLRVFIDLDLAGHVDEALYLLRVAFLARSLRFTRHKYSIDQGSISYLSRGVGVASTNMESDASMLARWPVISRKNDTTQYPNTTITISVATSNPTSFSYY